MQMEAATAFLLEVKLCLSRGEGTLQFVEREVNLRTLAATGATVFDVRIMIQHLRLEQYCQGPLSDDKGRDMQWWVFGASLSGRAMYLKIALHKGRVVCLSCHPAARPLAFPLRTVTSQEG
jgi:hypothetical protein